MTPRDRYLKYPSPLFPYKKVGLQKDFEKNAQNEKFLFFNTFIYFQTEFKYLGVTFCY